MKTDSRNHLHLTSLVSISLTVGLGWGPRFFKSDKIPGNAAAVPHFEKYYNMCRLILDFQIRAATFPCTKKYKLHTIFDRCRRSCVTSRTLCVCCVLVAQSYPTLYNPWSVARQASLSMGILQARILK